MNALRRTAGRSTTSQVARFSNSLRTLPTLPTLRTLSSSSLLPSQIDNNHNNHIIKSLNKPSITARHLSTRPGGAEGGAEDLDSLGSVDHGFSSDRLDPLADPEKRAFTYFLLGSARFAYASTARVILVKFVSSMSASADVLALASAEFELGDIPEGGTITVKWRGKPIFIKNRTDEEIADAQGVDMGSLRDKEADAERVQQDKWLIVLGICTHLGCVPISNAGDYGGWFCPCHGSHYDVSGRIRMGPAPLNLEIPPYKFLSDEKIIIG